MSDDNFKMLEAFEESLANSNTSQEEQVQKTVDYIPVPGKLSYGLHRVENIKQMKALDAVAPSFLQSGVARNKKNKIY